MEKAPTYLDTLAKCAVRFQDTFDMPLYDLMCPATGFDIILFDKWIQTPDDVSIRDFVYQKYGIKAVELIEELLGKEKRRKCPTGLEKKL